MLHDVEAAGNWKWPPPINSRTMSITGEWFSIAQWIAAYM